MRRIFDAQSESVLEHAKCVALEMHHNYIGSEHLLLGILKEDCELTKYLKQQGVDYDSIYEDCRILFSLNKQNEDEIMNTALVEEILDKAADFADHENKQEISLTHLCAGLHHVENCVAMELIYRYDITHQELGQLYVSCTELDYIKELRNLNITNSNLHVVGREKEMETILDILCRKEKANPLLIGEAGVGKSAIVEKLANLIESKQVPSFLYHHTIYELNLNALVAGTKYRGDFEEKLEKNYPRNCETTAYDSFY